MKKILHILRPVILMGIGLIMAVLSAMVSSVPSQAGQKDLMGAALQYSLQATPTIAPEQGVSEIGSTDGIVLMGIIIVLIVVLPAILQRRTWKR
jgi:hypothetical protein